MPTQLSSMATGLGAAEEVNLKEHVTRLRAWVGNHANVWAFYEFLKDGDFSTCQLCVWLLLTCISLSNLLLHTAASLMAIDAIC